MNQFLPTGWASLKVKLLVLGVSLLATVVLAGAAYTLGVLAGKKAEATSGRAATEKARADRLADENEALEGRLAQQRAITAGDQRTVLTLHERLATADQTVNALQQEVPRVRLVSRSSGGDRACRGGADAPGALDAAAGGGVVGAPGAGGAGLAPAGQGAPGADDGGDRVPLTLAAVGLYDRALFATDPGAPELAAVPCRALGSAGAAADAKRCEAFAGVFLDDLFRVHTANAAACAKDRERLGSLIEAIQARERIYLGTTP